MSDRKLGFVLLLLLVLVTGGIWSYFFLYAPAHLEIQTEASYKELYVSIRGKYPASSFTYKRDMVCTPEVMCEMEFLPPLNYEVIIGSPWYQPVFSSVSMGPRTDMILQVQLETDTTIETDA